MLVVKLCYFARATRQRRVPAVSGCHSMTDKNSAHSGRAHRDSMKCSGSCAMKFPSHLQQDVCTSQVIYSVKPRVCRAEARRVEYQCPCMMSGRAAGSKHQMPKHRNRDPKLDMEEAVKTPSSVSCTRAGQIVSAFAWKYVLLLCETFIGNKILPRNSKEKFHHFL